MSFLRQWRCTISHGRMPHKNCKRYPLTSVLSVSPARGVSRASRATLTSTPCWTIRACAALSAVAATPTARGSVSRWEATTHGRTTTEAAEWSVEWSCPATGGWHAFWVWCSNPTHLGNGRIQEGRKVGRREGGRDGVPKEERQREKFRRGRWWLIIYCRYLLVWADSYEQHQ